MSKEHRTFTRDEVAKHDKEDDLWIVIDTKVYDVSKFQNLHPGGKSVFYQEEIPGNDATEAFYALHRHEVIVRPQYARLQIGVIEGEEPEILTLSAGEASKVPYAEPTWLAEGFRSPYYKDSHRALQKAVRSFVDTVITPDALAREADGKRPSLSVIKAMADQELHAARMGPGKHLKGRKIMGGIVKPEEFDYFHELIITQELTRAGQRGYGDGLQAGCVIGLPPVLNFGSEALKAKIVPEVLSGEKFICLAVSEAFAGSDVAGLQCRAEKSEDGKYWIVNGTKKWITNGTFCDYFTTGCKTADGFTVMLIERSEGVETKPIKTSYSPSAGTSFVTFDNVKVPVENTLGPEGGGLMVMLSNFNHERWVMCCGAARSQRLIVEECMKWIQQRKAFGKPLSSQAVIRSMMAQMIHRCEATQNWLENVTHQMNNMSYKEQSSKLAGQIANLKSFTTHSGQLTARDAVMVFGGRGITKTGQGQFVEHYHRTVTFDSILGGAEDVLADLTVRQAMRQMPPNVRL